MLVLMDRDLAVALSRQQHRRRESQLYVGDRYLVNLFNYLQDFFKSLFFTYFFFFWRHKTLLTEALYGGREHTQKLKEDQEKGRVEVSIQFSLDEAARSKNDL